MCTHIQTYNTTCQFMPVILLVFPFIYLFFHNQTNNPLGSTGNLNRSKRLSTSSSNISGRKTPTPTSSSSRLRSHIITPRATTPTVAFGSSVRSRPTTPTFSPHTSSTPQRPGSVTPTKGLGSGPTRQRRLPSTPTSSSQGFR